MQEFGLNEFPASTRRSPAGFGFDLNALLDDASESEQHTGSAGLGPQNR